MGQHWPAHHVADSVDIRCATAAMAIHFDEAAGVDLDANGFRAKIRGIRRAADRHDQLVELTTMLNEQHKRIVAPAFDSMKEQLKQLDAVVKTLTEKK